jgi:hypothetical protein
MDVGTGELQTTGSVAREPDYQEKNEDHTFCSWNEYKMNRNHLLQNEGW